MSLPRRPLAAALVLLGLAACGGGSGPVEPALGPGENAYEDPQAYSTAADAALAGAEEAHAVTKHSLVLGGRTLAYTARAGHLIARDPAGVAEASFFHVSYLLDGADAATRPVTFFYNGGPGSASVWLHLGSFGPRRLATGVPSTAGAVPAPLVDNAESLLDVTDLVFVDAVGTGYSQAIAPRRNIDFWGVDADAAVLRDFVVRWLAAHGRGASPRFLFGESYGGPRTAVLARRLQEAGVALAGLVLQSPALDYNSNCGVTGYGNCGRVLPTYGAAGAWHGVAAAATTPLDGYVATLRDFADSRFVPALDAWSGGAPLPAELPPLLQGYTGIGAASWRSNLNLGPDTFQHALLPGFTLGRYDSRMKAANGSPLAAEGDPSSTFITPSFRQGMAQLLPGVLRYRSASTYVLVSNAIASWNFAHEGRALPDTVPDLAAVLAADPALRVLAVSGVHDLATPFHVTENDLARLGAGARVTVRNYAGGHMSYLDDATRAAQKADLAAWYAGTLAARSARAEPFALKAAPATDRAGTPPAAVQPVVPQAPLQAPLRDPWVPPRR